VTRRRALVAAGGMFVGCVYLANWLVENVGIINVWPTHLYAPAGVYVIGLAFLLRDTIQRFAGQRLALLLIAAGAGLSALVSPRLALASACAFLASEVLGLGLFWGARGNTAGPAGLAGAVVASSVAAAAVDSLVFLWIAFGRDGLAFWEGQFVAKVMVTALAVPFVLAARRRWPAAAPEAAR
jgi:uncharacterized PurR-regulated membrane protein YhhQ (DUF165 family)